MPCHGGPYKESHAYGGATLAALVAIKHQVVPFYNLYHRIYEKTACKMKGYVGVQRKLLIMLYTLWKKDEFFDEQYGIESAEEKQLLSILPTEAGS